MFTARMLIMALGSLQLLAQGPPGDLETLRHTGVYSPGFGMSSKPEYTLDVSGEWSVLDEQRLAILDPSGRATEVRQAPPLPHEGSALKYRAGRFWARGGASSILEYLPGERAWVPRLLARTPFKDFEVTFDGRILLIVTPRRLVEFYQPMSSQAEWTLDYPAMEGLPDGRDPGQDPYFFWAFPVCARIEENLLIYFPNLGRLYRTDILKPGLQEMEVPWTRLSIRLAAKEGRAPGFIAVTGRPPFNGIEFIPETASRVRILYSINNAQFGMSPPTGGDPRPKIFESTPSSEHGVHWFSVDLGSGQASEVHDEPGMALPLALDFKGDLVPIKALFSGSPVPSIRPESLPSGGAGAGTISR